MKKEKIARGADERRKKEKKCALTFRSFSTHFPLNSHL